MSNYCIVKLIYKKYILINLSSPSFRKLGVVLNFQKLHPLWVGIVLY